MKTTDLKCNPLSVLCRATLCAGVLWAGQATAGEPPGVPAPEATAAASSSPVAAGAGAAPAPPYSLPWQLRPVAAATVIRADSSVAFYDNAAGQSGDTVATILTGSYKLTPHLAPLVKLGFAQNDAPGATPNGSSFVNPLVGVTYARRVDSFRWAAFAGAAIPVGQGSGDHPDGGVANANKAAIAARAGMDNSMFAVNYFTPIVGADAAYVDHKLTIQAEATLFQLLRVHGDDAGGASTDAARTNSTVGIHLGYFVIPMLSFGAELRYQRYLGTITQLNTMGMKVNIPDANRDTATFAVGPRAHFSVGRGIFMRPGISYTRGLDQPLSTQSYNTLQVDVPVVF
jgi:hypothetical protein